MSIPDKFNSNNILLIKEYIDKIPVEKKEDFAIVSEALKSLTDSSQPHLVPESLKGRVEAIKELLDNPDLYVQDENLYDSFKETIINEVKKTIQKFSLFNEGEKEEYIADQQAALLRAQTYQGKIKITQPPQGAAQTISNDDTLDRYNTIYEIHEDLDNILNDLREGIPYGKSLVTIVLDYCLELKWSGDERWETFSLENLTPELKNDKEIVLKTITLDPNNLKFASLDLQKDSEVVLASRSLKFASPELKKDKDFILKFFNQNSSSNEDLEFVDPQLQNDPKVVLASRSLKFASPELKKDKDFIVKFFNQGYYEYDNLEFVDPQLQNDPKVVLASGSLKFASPALKKDKDFILKFFSQKSFPSEDLKFVDPQLQNDPEVVLASQSLKFASPELKKDKDFILKFFNQNSSSNEDLKFVDPQLQNDPEMVLASGSLKFASPELKKNKDFILRFFNQSDLRYGDLKFIDPQLQNDPEVVLASGSLTHAPSELKQNRDFVLKMIRKNPGALYYASSDLRGDFNFCLEAARVNSAVLRDAETISYDWIEQIEKILEEESTLGKRKRGDEEDLTDKKHQKTKG